MAFLQSVILVLVLVAVIRNPALDNSGVANGQATAPTCVDYSADLTALDICRIEILNFNLGSIIGSDGQPRTVIRDLDFIIWNTAGEDITDQIQTDELRIALSEALGGSFEIVINEDGDPELNQPDEDPDNVGVFNLDATYEFELIIKGLYLDFQFQTMFQEGLFAAYQAVNGDAFAEMMDKNLTCVVPRIDETTGVIGADFSLVYFFFIYDDPTAQDEIGYLDPSILIRPAPSSLSDALEAVGFDNIIVQTVQTPTFKNIQISFGLFVDGNVYEEDLPMFLDILQQFWQSEQGDRYATVTCEAGFIEKYFTSIETGRSDLDTTMMWRQVTRVGYYVKFSNGQTVTPRDVNLFYPSERRIQTYVTANSLSVSGAVGVDYSFLIRDDITVDHTTLSTSELRREKEAFVLHIDGSVSPLNFPDIAAVLQAQFRAIAPVQTVARLLDFTNADVQVLQTQTMFSRETLLSYTAVLCYVSRTLDDGSVALFDGRRVAMSLPSVESMMPELTANIQAPDGNSYSFLTQQQVVALGSIKTEQDLFVMVCDGPLYSSDYNRFESALFSSLETTVPDIFDQNNFENVFVDVYGNKEFISTVNGASLSVLYYSISMYSQGETIFMSRETRFEANITVQTLEANIGFARIDGSSYIFRENYVYAMSQWVNNMFSLYTSSPIMTSDLSLFATQLQTYYESVLTEIGNFEVIVPRQEESKGLERLSVTRVGIFIMSESYGAIAPVTIPTVVTVETISASVNVVGPAGAYAFITDMSIIDNLLRVNELFAFGLTTDIAIVTEVTLEQALVEASATGLNVQVSSVVINIRSVDEWVLADGSSAYNVMFDSWLDGEFVSARSTAPLAPATLSTTIASVSLPSGMAYTSVVIDFSDSVYAASLVVTPFSRPIVDTTNSFVSIQAVFISELFTSITSTYPAITEADISIEIIRQREVVTVDMESVFMVDVVVNVGPDRIFPGIFPQLPAVDFAAALPAVPAGGPAYAILDVDISTTVQLDMAFSLTLDVFELRMSDVTAIESTIQVALASTTAFVDFTGLLSVTVISVQAVVDALTGASYTNCYYSITLDSWLVLDARVEAQIDISLLVSGIGQISGPSGSVYSVVTADVELYRRVESLIMVLEGPFSRLDWNWIADLGAGLLVDLEGGFSVTVIQVNELISVAGARFSEVVCIVEGDSGIVLPLTLPQLDMDGFIDDLVEGELSVSGLSYTFVYRSELELAVTDIRNCFTMYLDAQFIQAADIVAIQANFQALFAGMADFGDFGSITVTIAGQFELIGTNGESIIEVPIIAMGSNGLVISSHVISTLTIANMQQGFNVLVTNSAMFYSASISTLSQVQLSASLDYRDLGLLVLDQFIAEDQIAAIQTAVLAIYEADNPQYDLNIEIQKIEQCFGAGASGFGIFFSARDNGNFLLPIDLAVSNLDTALVTFVSSITTNAGASYSLVTEISSSTVVRMSQTVSGVFALSRPLQESDMGGLAGLVSQVVSSTLSGVRVSGTVTVDILGQFSFVMSSSLSSTYYDIVFNVNIDGQLFDARAFPGLDMDAVMVQAFNIVYTGTELEFVDIAINIQAVIESGVSIVYLSSLTFIPIVDPLPVQAFATLNAALDMYCAADLGLSAANVRITIWLQEEISSGGMSMWQIGFGLEVRIDGEWQLLDARGMTALDLSALFSFIERDFSGLLDMGFSVAVDIEVESIVRLEEANLICFTNELMNGDITTVINNIASLYIDIMTEFEDAELELIKIEAATTADSDCSDEDTATEYIQCLQQRLSCFYFTAELNGMFIQQLPDPDQLAALLSSSPTSHQQEFDQYVETRDSVVISSSSLFTFHMTSFIRDLDAEAVFSAITDAWTAFAGEAVTVSFMTQYEVYLSSGMLLVEVKYAVQRGGIFLNANFEGSVEISAIISALERVPVTGAVEATMYSSLIYQSVVVDTVLKSSLCTLVMTQQVAMSQYGDLTTRLNDAWRVVDSSVSSVQLFAQEEVIVESSYSAWVVYFRGIADNNGPLECVSQNSDFILSLVDGLDGFLTVRGFPFAIVPLSDALASVSIEQGFSMYFTTTVTISDLEQISAAIVETWLSTFGETVEVDITVQQECVSMSAETVFRVVFFVRSQTGLLFDARLIAGLSSDQINGLLTRIENPRCGCSYDELQYSGQISALFVYEHRFTIDLIREVKTLDMQHFVDLIKNVFVAEGLFGSTGDFTVIVVKLEEVFDATGVSYFQLVYFIRSTLVVDARVTAMIAQSVWATALDDAAILGPQDIPYQIAVDIEMPIYRLEQCHSLYVAGRVQFSQNVDFAVALQTVWRTVAGFSDVDITVVTQLEMISNNQFATSITYIMENDNALIIESMVSALSVSDVFAELGSNVLDANGNAYVLLEGVEVLRYRYHFGAFLTSPVLLDDVDSLAENLLEQWETSLPSLSPLSIQFGLQEEMLTQSGAFVWQFVYFLEYGTGNDITLVNSNLFSLLDQDKLEEALSLRVSGSSDSSEEYVDLIVAEDMLMDLMRVEDFFSIYVSSAVIRTQYEAFAAQITQVWQAFDSDFSATVTVVALDKYLTESSTFVYRLYYKAEIESTLVVSRLVAAPAVSLFVNAIGEIDSLQGTGFVVVDPAETTVRRYSSAFFTFLVMPVTRQDNSDILVELTSAWQPVFGSGMGLELTFGIQEEFISSTGDSVWRFSYFASTTDIAVRNAQFSTSLARNTLQGIFTTQQVFQGDMTSLINFADLLGVALTTRVAIERYTDFNTAMLNVYESFTEFDDMGTLSIEIITQEEYLTAEGVFVYNMLYAVKINGMPVGPILLPRIPILADLGDIGSITDLSGDNYLLSTIEQGMLRRFKNAMSFFTSEWISRSTRLTLLSEIQTSVTSMLSDIEGSITVEFGAQEWYFYNGDNAITPMRPIRFSVFVLVDGSVINGALEQALDASSLSSVSSIALTSQDVQASLNVRNAFMLNIDGFLPEADEAVFVTKLAAAWGDIEAGITIEFAARMEFIGERGVPVHSLHYFVFYNDDTLVLPGELENADVSSLGVTSSVTGMTYEAYEGMVVSYDMQYSILVHGEITADVAVEIFEATRTVWESSIPNVDIMFELVKLELGYGDLGALVTRVLYTVNINDVATFPANDPAPEMTSILSALDVISLFEEDAASVFRYEDHFMLPIMGELVLSVKDDVEVSIVAAWQAAGVDSTNIVVAGREVRWAADNDGELNNVFYRLVRADGTVLLPYEKQEPAQSLFNLPSATGLSVYSEPTLRVQNILLTSQLTNTEITTFETVTAQLWTDAQGSGSFLSTSTFDDQSAYGTADDIAVTKVFYAVSINDASPELLMPPALAPLAADYGAGLGDAGIPSTCGCVAKKTFRLLIAGDNVNNQVDAINNAIEGAWTTMNPDSDVSTTTMSASATRKKRDNHDDVTFSDAQGNELTPVDYEVTVGGSDPDPFFVNVPSLDDIAAAVEEATDGLTVCTADCDANVCSKTTLEDKLSNSDIPKIDRAVTAAYLEANPDLEESDIEVTISILDNDLEDQDGNDMTEVQVCVSRLDDGNLDDIVTPDDDTLDDNLRDEGLRLADPDAMATESTSNVEVKWIAIIIAICSVAAVVIVILAVVKVIHRKRQWGREDDVRSAYASGILKDEEDYAGHGTAYHSPIYGSTYKSHNGSLNSKVQFYDDRQMIFPA